MCVDGGEEVRCPYKVLLVVVIDVRAVDRDRVVDSVSGELRKTSMRSHNLSAFQKS